MKLNYERIFWTLNASLVLDNYKFLNYSFVNFALQDVVDVEKFFELWSFFIQLCVTRLWNSSMQEFLISNLLIIIEVEDCGCWREFAKFWIGQNFGMHHRSRGTDLRAKEIWFREEKGGKRNSAESFHTHWKERDRS